MSEPLLVDLGKKGRRGVILQPCDVPKSDVSDLLGAQNISASPPLLPEVDQPSIVRHFTRLSQMNFSIDTNFYPLGSCTMKYNPKINEDVAMMSGLSSMHPLQNEEGAQGLLEMMFNLEKMFCEIGGMDFCTLQPAAGAQGEFLGLLLMAAWHRSNGEGERRTKILVPDSAHGTNAASAARAGFTVHAVDSNDSGCVDLAALENALGDDVAGVMATNPNTFGLFERDIQEISRLTHDSGALLYYDGANLNAIMGQAKPGHMGCDIMHFNLHKTFSTPHGGGGPGSGPVAVRKFLEPFLPVPVIEQSKSGFGLSWDRAKSIGKVHGFWGNVGMHVRAYSYIRSYGPDGLKRVSEDAVLNANYLMSKLKKVFPVAYPGLCKHEFVLTLVELKKKHGGWKLVADIAKRLLDYGFYAPTVYFPTTVEESVMIEPTETESKETLDAFAVAMRGISQEIKDNPDMVRSAPHKTPVRRLDETRAARQLILRWGK